MALTLTCAGLGGYHSDGGRRGGTEDRFTAAMPAWHRRSHAPGWEGVAATGAPRSKSAPDGREAHPGSTIVRRTGRVLQRRTDDEGWRRKAPTLVSELSPECPLRADDGYASGRGGVTARRRQGLILRRVATAETSATNRVHCGSRGRGRTGLFAETMEVRGWVPETGTPSYACGKPTDAGISPVFTKRHPETKERAKPSDQ